MFKDDANCIDAHGVYLERHFSALKTIQRNILIYVEE